MKKNAFSLVELIASIVILSILIAVGVRIFTNVRKNVLEKQYQNILSDIYTKAEEYAKNTGKTDPIDISVDFLIKNGLISPDDDKNIYDPREKNKKLNCYIIHVILEDGEYKASLGKLQENEDGTCYNENREDTIEIVCNNKSCKDGWYNENLILTIKGLSDEELKTSIVEWTSLNGLYELQASGTNKSIVVNPSYILNTTYSALIKTSKKTYDISKVIKIDKEKPKLISKDIKINYENNQTLDIDATDLTGSGILGYALTKDSCENATYNTNKLKITSSGKQKICIKDNASNIYEEEININKVTFNYNEKSNKTETINDVYFLKENPNQELPKPSRNGYVFKNWVKKSDGSTIYEFDNLNDSDEAIASWDIIDVALDVEKINKGSKNAIIANKVNMILVLDVSGSMLGNAIENLKQVSSELVNSMSFEVGSTISIIQFSSTAQILLEVGTNKEEALKVIRNIPGTPYTTSFNNGLSKANYIIEKHLLGQDNNYMIFVSDGYDNDEFNRSYADMVKVNLKTSYSIGIGTSIDVSGLTYIASPSCYFNSTSGLDSLGEVFSHIQEEIREQVQETSKKGLIELPNLYVDSENPFSLKINDETIYTFTDINEMSDILVHENNIYYLDLEKIDNKYKLEGNLKTISFAYYYDGE